MAQEALKNDFGARRGEKRSCGESIRRLDLGAKRPPQSAPPFELPTYGRSHPHPCKSAGFALLSFAENQLRAAMQVMKKHKKRSEQNTFSYL